MVLIAFLPADVAKDEEFPQVVKVELARAVGRLSRHIVNSRPLLLFLHDVPQALRYHIHWYTVMYQRAQKKYPELFRHEDNLDDEEEAKEGEHGAKGKKKKKSGQGSSKSKAFAEYHANSSTFEEQQAAIVKEFASANILHPACDTFAAVTAAELSRKNSKKEGANGPSTGGTLGVQSQVQSAAVESGITTEIQYLKSVVKQVLPSLLGPGEAGSPVGIMILTDILACNVLHPLMDAFDPASVCQSLVSGLEKAKEEAIASALGDGTPSPASERSGDGDDGASVGLEPESTQLDSEGEEPPELGTTQRAVLGSPQHKSGNSIGQALRKGLEVMEKQGYYSSPSPQMKALSRSFDSDSFSQSGSFHLEEGRRMPSEASMNYLGGGGGGGGGSGVGFTRLLMHDDLQAHKEQSRHAKATAPSPIIAPIAPSPRLSPLDTPGKPIPPLHPSSEARKKPKNKVSWDVQGLREKGFDDLGGRFTRGESFLAFGPSNGKPGVAPPPLHVARPTSLAKMLQKGSGYIVKWKGSENEFGSIIRHAIRSTLKK